MPTLFFLISIATLKDYGMNWDEPVHYMRGQAYLRLLLSGKTNYSTTSLTKISYFQNNSMNGKYFLQNDSGHPPANGILASLFNKIFYQKLDLVGDLESYHLFIVFVSFLAILTVSYFAYEVLGTMGSVVAGLVFATYPLFFAEAHFNIKDPVETAFYTITIWAFWKSLQKGNWKWLILSSVFCGLALGTKFNILFLPFIILPYLVVRYRKNIFNVKKWFTKIPTFYKISVILAPFIIFGIFVYLWPYLWANSVGNFFNIARYYKDIGTGINYQSQNFYWMKFNVYAIYWIIITTPPVVLFLSLIGLLSIVFGKTTKNKTEILWLLWFLIPVVRVILPSSSIYGGVRQIMEYIPGMALLSAFGARSLIQFLKSKFRNFIFIRPLFLLFILISLIMPIWKYHPNENVYFNFLVGGLKGAMQKRIPSAGNSFGNAYWQAVKWINQNAEPNSKLALIQGTGQNIPTIELRNDISFSNNYWSGINRKGEYLLELNIEPSSWAYHYCWEFVTEMLLPVYEVKSDGVVLATVWKNDLAHTLPQYKKPEIRLWDYRLDKDGQGLEVTFKKEESVTRFYLRYQPDNICSGVSAEIRSSLDNKTWKTELESIPNLQVTVDNLQKNMSPFFFAGRDLKYLKIITSDKNSCLLKSSNLEIWGLE